MLIIGERSTGAKHERVGADEADTNFLRELHARLSLNTAEDAISWVDDGTRFKIRVASEASLISWFGKPSEAFRQTLESLNFQCREERESGELLFAHSEFSKCKLPSVNDFVQHNSRSQDKQCQEALRMPDVSYNPMLNPLEVRVKCSKAAASHSELWQVVIASSLQPGMTSSERVASYFLQEDEATGSDSSTPPGVDLYFDSERPPCYSSSSQDREPESYSWVGRPSESSSLCLDDFTDIDILSQISAYYG